MEYTSLTMCIVILSYNYLSEATILKFTIDDVIDGEVAYFYCRCRSPVTYVSLNKPDGITAIMCRTSRDCEPNLERVFLVADYSSSTVIVFGMKRTTKQDEGLWSCQDNTNSMTARLTVIASDHDDVTSTTAIISTSSYIGKSSNSIEHVSSSATGISEQRNTVSNTVTVRTSWADVIRTTSTSDSSSNGKWKSRAPSEAVVSSAGDKARVRHLDLLVLAFYSVCWIVNQKELPLYVTPTM